MRIVFVVDHMGSGGAERVVANLSNEMVMHGCELWVVMVNEDELKSHYPLDIKVNLIPLKENYKYNSPIKKLSLLRACFRKIKPEVIISFLHHINMYTHFAIAGLRIPHIVSERADPETFPVGRLLRILRDYIFSRAEGCVFQTGKARSFFSRKIQQKSVIIPNPVVLMNEQDIVIEREKSIAAVGRFTFQKNYAMMIRAFAVFLEKYPGYNLIICGDGNLRKDIESLIDRLHIKEKVILVGQVDNPHEIIYRSAIFALSSDHEGMPNALLEAMALGVPSVSTDCPSGGPAEIIRNNENGVLVPVGDVNAMADAFIRIASDTEFSNILSQNCRKIKEAYSVRTITEKWLGYIQQVKSSYNM